MKATGIVRKIDSLGRVVLPIELRRNLDIDENAAMEIYVDGDSVVLKKYEPSCVFCGEAEDVKLYRGRNVCAACRKAISNLD